LAAVFRYRYELRRNDDLVATGHLTLDEPLEVGDHVTIGRSHGLVHSVMPTLGKHERQLIVQLLPAETDP
jgi:hypothetical protein